MLELIWRYNMATPAGSLSANEVAYFQGAVQVAVTRIYQQEIAPLKPM